MAPLPEAFLILRREALIVAVNRVFQGSTIPIPEMAPWLGVYHPMPTDGVQQAQRFRESAAKERHNRRNRAWREAQPREERIGPRQVRFRPTHHRNPCRSVARGSIPPGARVLLHGGQVAKVLAFLPAWADPMAIIPHAFEPTRIMGVSRPSVNPRYLVQVNVGRGPRLYFPRAAALERDNPQMTVAV